MIEVMEVSFLMKIRTMGMAMALSMAKKVHFFMP